MLEVKKRTLCKWDTAKEDGGPADCSDPNINIPWLGTKQKGSAILSTVTIKRKQLLAS
jgi:hypothetical protein